MAQAARLRLCVLAQLLNYIGIPVRTWVQGVQETLSFELSMNEQIKLSSRLLAYLRQTYALNEFPALYEQYLAWRETRPFAGCRILEATPLFRNTLAKFLPLLAGGASVSVSGSSALLFDQNILKLLPQFGIERENFSAPRQAYDLIMDCAGIHANTPSRCGYVELTRSGLEHYREKKAPVFLADEGQCKVIETSLGTGDGFFRAMQKLGYRQWEKKTVAIFGAGKVGCGIAFYCHKAGADVYLIDDSKKTTAPAGIKLLDWHDYQNQEEILFRADCIITATGVAGALRGHPLIPRVLRKPVLLANMGVEDEFGDAVPDKTRVLKQNQPLNFILEEPTRLPFIDPTMALSNIALLELLQGKMQAGLNLPKPQQEQDILQTIRQKGCIGKELECLPVICPASAKLPRSLKTQA